MSGAETRWTLRREESHFRPPRNAGFSFGEAVPFWFSWHYRAGRRGGRHGGYFQQSGAPGGIVARGSGVLGDDGRLALKQKLVADDTSGRICTVTSAADPRGCSLTLDKPGAAPGSDPTVGDADAGPDDPGQPRQARRG